MLVNTAANRDPRAQPAAPDDFDPFALADRRQGSGVRSQESGVRGDDHVPIEVLRWAWVENQPGR